MGGDEFPFGDDAELILPDQVVDGGEPASINGDEYVLQAIPSEKMYMLPVSLRSRVASDSHARVNSP